MQSAHRQREKKVEKYGRILIEISNKTWIIIILYMCFNYDWKTMKKKRIQLTKASNYDPLFIKNKMYNKS